MGIFSRQKMSVHLVLIGCAILLALVASVTADRISPVYGALDSGRYTLPGHMISALKRYKAQHTTNKNNQLQLAISLNLRNRVALTTLIAAQNDPNSTSYHQYLTPKQFIATFGPTQATVDSVVSYLKGQGLKVKSVAPNNLLIDVSGSVATVEQAFGVTLNDYVIDGRAVYAPASDPTVPDALSTAILNIGGLDNTALYHHAGLTRQNKQATGPAGGYTPAELRTAYDENKLISNGGTGAGQTTAIFELDGYNPSDISTYLSQYHLGAAKYSNVLIDQATNTPANNAVEVELDMEIVSALAPDATQKIYIGPNYDAGINDTYNAIVTDDQAKVTSISWGTCEANLSNSEISTLDNIFAQGAAQGQAFFAASGDAGAYDCLGNTTTLAVGSPVDDPNVVGVGGTTLHVGSDGTYSSETVWSDASRGEGSGGGISTQFTRPTYQTGPNLTNLNREVPDVSANADPATGYSIYCTVAASGCPSSGWAAIGGTSAAAPLWAATATDLNEYLAGQHKAVLGSASASLYSLYNTPQTYSAYHDITMGNNLYYPATPGYDTASGIGTPDVWNIARDLANATTGGGNSGPTQLLKNAGFDSGSTSWIESSSGAYEIVDTTRPHAGGTSAEICGYATCNDQIYQTVTLPSTTTKVVLSYWTYISTPNTGKTCVDYLYARLRTSSGTTIATPKTLCNVNAAGWTQYTFDVTSTLTKYFGKSIEVYFNGTTQASSASDFFVDDVALNVTHS